jgi:hypothetical protein
MKKTLSILAAVLLLALGVKAGTLIGSLTTISTPATNSVTFTTNTASIALPVIYVSSNVSATNSYNGFFRWSFDGTTFYTNNSPVFFPAVTNGTTTVAPQVVSVPVYIQMYAVTNAGQVGPVQVGAFTP